ncbi:MAG: hypothetical protein P8Y18_00350 [Candidatus Bathyarchaeota archaeon]
MKSNEEKLPIKGNLKVVYILSVLIACIFVFTSVYGILLGSTIYPTEELFNNFISNDFVNLLIGLPIILVSIVFTLRCKLVGLLFLPGSLLFIIYNYLIYILAIPLNWVIPFYLILIISSLYAIIKLFTSINGEKIQKLLKGAVHERISGTILIGLGLLFMIQAASAIIELIINQIQIIGIELAVHISDFAISPFLIIGGTLLLRRKTFGYVSGLGLLFQASMLFIGLIVFLIIEPLLTTTPFPIVDIIVVSIMGLISFIPLTLFILGVNEKDNSSISKS